MVLCSTIVPDQSHKPITQAQQQLVDLIGSGHSWNDAARKLGVGRTTVFRWRELPAVAEALAAVGHALPDTTVARARVQAAFDLAETLSGDIVTLTEARTHGLAKLKGAMDAALSADKFGDFAKLLALACDRTGLHASKTVELDATLQQRPTPEQCDRMSRQLAEQLGIVPAASEEMH